MKPVDWRNHAACDACFLEETGRQAVEAVRMKPPPARACCYCGAATTSGIFLRGPRLAADRCLCIADQGGGGGRP